MPKGVQGFQNGHAGYRKKNGKIKSCLICSSSFYVAPNGSKTFCSKSCADKHKISKHGSTKTEFKKGLTPWNKGTKGIMKAWNKGMKGFKLSDSTKQKMKGRIPWNKGIEFLGKEKHWNWKGGLTPKNQVERMSIECRLWTKSVLIRDNFICQKYGTIGGKLIAHHINNFADFPELRSALDNGITLSKKAHDEFHKIYGRRHNTREQLNEFLCQI